MARYRTQHVAAAPAGWRVRSKRASGHVLRIAFPPGRRKRGDGRVVEVLHPKRENPGCDVERKNPEQLLIFGLGNPGGPDRMDWMREMIERLSADYKRMIAAGWSQEDALDETLRRSTAGPGAIAEFKKRVGITNPRRQKTRKKRNATGGFGNHKPGCPCAFCQRAAKLQSGALQPPALPNRKRRNAQRGWAVLEKGRDLKHSSFVSWPTRAQAEKALRETSAYYPGRPFHIVRVKGGENPGACGARWRKPAGAITDRGLRYRANSPECRPRGPRVCAFCGAKRNVEVNHIDGHEENTAPANLVWGCRSCNTTMGQQLKKAGVGRLTHQYNPSEGAQSLKQWVTAVLAMKGQNDAMTVPAAVKMIHATPADARSRFAEQIWKRRRQHGRRNPDEAQQAVQLFQTFHGKDPRGVVEKQEPAIMREDYTAIGPLEHLVIKSPLGQSYKVEFEGDGVMLASSPDGRQLYCIGGNQNLAGVLDADSLQKDLIDLGECIEVQYLARKVHTNFEPVSWHHSFGEKSGERPELIYDKLKRRIFFAGGAYYIDTSAEISPGIEN